MVMIALYSLLYVFLIFVDLIPLYKNKESKPIWIYTIIMAFSYIILVLIGIGIKIPSPAPIIIKLVSLITGI